LKLPKSLPPYSTRYGFQPTYEELKHGAFEPRQTLILRFQPTYEELKPSPRNNPETLNFTCFQPTYEELKPEYVSWKQPDVASFQPTYEELKLFSGREQNHHLLPFPAYL